MRVKLSEPNRGVGLMYGHWAYKLISLYNFSVFDLDVKGPNVWMLYCVVKGGLGGGARRHML